MKILKLILGNTLVLVAMCGVVELSYSTYRYISRRAPDPYWLWEHPDETYRFDPSRGIFLMPAPSRFARVTEGHIEYVGAYRGNNQGFPDRDDFTPRRAAVNQKRLAVFGDSFTAAQYISLSWPDRVEDISEDQSLQLLNFSLDGVGLANWANVIRNVIATQRYELDGLIFAVWMTDLDRKFKFYFQLDEHTMGCGSAPTWDVGAQPKTRSDARRILRALNAVYVLSPAEFDAALSNGPPRTWRVKAFDHISSMVESASRWLGLVHQAPLGSTAFEPGQMALIAEIKEFAVQRSLRVLVVYIPGREELLQPGHPSDMERVKRFSQILGASFVDGRDAFKGLSRQQIKASWLPYDGHWNQAGSDRFAAFMAEELRAWPGLRDPTGH